MKIKFYLRQAVKIAVRQVFLPMVYRIACLRHPKVDPRYVILADAHHRTLPDSMTAVKEELLRRGFRVEEMVLDYQKAPAAAVLRHILTFMDRFAMAGGVFLCDYFLPVTACRKRKATTVVQLWHACGAFKKFGYDAEDDIPGFFSDHMFDNLDLVTVSSPSCVPHYASAFHLPEERVRATGISRTDKFFREEYREQCRSEFFEACPEAKGRKILVWAPTFRGNAALAELTGYDDIQRLEQELGPEWYVVIKLHPHMEGKCQVNHTSLPIERLLPAADALISDFSSVIFEYSLFRKPIYLYAPDAGEYRSRRGVYEDGPLPGPVLTDGETLRQCILEDLTCPQPEGWDRQGVHAYCRRQMECCDGNSTARILEQAGF